MSLSGKTLKDSYIDLLQLDNSNSGMPTSVMSVKDGSGTRSALWISDDQVRIVPNNDDTTTALMVRSKSGATVMQVDSTNNAVYCSGNVANTQYATFSVGNSESTSFVDDTHHPIPFGSANYGDTSGIPALGTGTDPATTFTTAEGSNTRASDLVPVMWYIQDDIDITAITSIEGADAATGDTTRMHLFSYDFTSGATSCLTNGTLVAHNSDVTNAGSEQPYLSSWTVDNKSVSAGKVVLATFKSDSINSDYSLNITVKYNLT